MAQSKTDFVYLTGKVKYVSYIQPNEWGAWDFILYPTAESLEQIREMQAKGLKNVVKKDDDGYHVRFRRPTFIERRNGQKVPLSPPLVVDKDGNPLEDTRIGNGSDATVKLEVYGFRTNPGIAARWAALRIDNLIPFDKEQLSDEEAELYAGMDKQPAREF